MFKKGYETLMDKSETMSDILFYQKQLDELREEEKEILNRSDVKI